MMSSEGLLEKCLVQADAGHRPNLATGHCRDRPRPLDPHEMTHGPGGSVGASVRELAGTDNSGRRTRQFGAQRGADVSTTTGNVIDTGAVGL